MFRVSRTSAFAPTPTLPRKRGRGLSGWHGKLILFNMVNLMKINIIFGFLLLFPLSAAAQLRIEIVDGVPGALPIAVVPFQWDSEVPEPADTVSKIISANLARSGLFEPMDEADMIERPVSRQDVRFGSWRLLKVDYLVIGQVHDTEQGGYEIKYYLLDVHTGRYLLEQALSVGPGNLRFGAHRVSDAIFKEITGTPGAFATRIAYVVVTGEGEDQMFELAVADADGYAPQTVVSNSEPILSPSWSPDASKLAYVSFATGSSKIIVQDLYTGQNRTVSGDKGINGAPAWAPDGRKLAMSLSREGNSDIYVMDLQSDQFTRLTQHWGIDTEPAWSPDGRRLYFTSDRSGRPQIYVMNPDGSGVERVTHQGRYNARVSVSPDNRHLAVVNGEGNEYRIAVYDREREQLRVLTPGRQDESPSFAPNGSMILYSTREGQRGVLAAIAVDGSVRQRLVLSEGDVREPAWSPLIQ